MEPKPSSILFWDIGKHRFDMLVDGVYAISMTLLVLDLKVPEGLRDSAVLQMLLGLLPRIGVFALAFFTVGMIWLMDMISTRPFVRVDLPHVVLNIFALLFVALVPFTAAVMSSYPNTPWGSAAYGVNLFMIALSYAIAMTRGAALLVDEHAERTFLREATLMIWLCVAAAAVGVCVAIAAPRIAFAYFVAATLGATSCYAALVVRHDRRMHTALGKSDRGPDQRVSRRQLPTTRRSK